MKKITAVFAFMIVVVSTAFAQNAAWKVDPVHSKILFTVSYMVLTDVTGRFNDFDLTLTHRKEDFTDGKISAIIKVKSIDTDNEKRDGHLKSADFFDAEKYPEITFTGNSFKKTGKNTYKITGDLTIRDVTKSVVLDARYNGQAKDPWGNTRVGFKATTSVNRNDFGVRWNKVLEAGGWLVGENVDITMNIQLIKQKESKG